MQYIVSMEDVEMEVFSTSNRVIIIQYTNYFGRETFTPVNKLAKQFTDLLGQKTLTRKDIAKIKELGFIIQQKEIEL